MAQAQPSRDNRMEAQARLFISSKNYSSWSLRGWLIARMSGLPFTLESIHPEDAMARAELLNLTSSVRIPYLVHGEIEVWDVLAIAEYLNEICPDAHMYPQEVALRARARTVSAEMHSGFASLRAALPVNLHAAPRKVPVWSGVRADIERISEIWTECLTKSGGPFLFGKKISVADAMFAPVCTRYETYQIDLSPPCEAYKAHILALPDMRSWLADAQDEMDEVSELELDVEF